MDDQDPRHGTYAGVHAHNRDGSDLCEPCQEARRNYQRHLSYRHQSGKKGRINPARVRRHVLELQEVGMGYKEMARRAGVSHNTIYRVARGETATMTVIAAAKILSVLPVTPDAGYVPAHGARRRIRALIAIGYPHTWIAEQVGISSSNLSTMVLNNRPDRRNTHVQATTWRRIADLYERLHMTPGWSESARRRAAKRDWPPPLAYVDIDDPDETPTDWRYESTDRREALRDLADMGLGITEAARRLHLSRDAVERYCARHGMSDVYRKLAAREALRENQHSRGAVA